jgi:hypothetical protein
MEEEGILNPSDKWQQIKDYLQKKRIATLVDLKSEVRDGKDGKIITLITQLSMLDDVQSFAEQLDRGGSKLVGRLAPPEEY